MTGRFASFFLFVVIVIGAVVYLFSSGLVGRGFHYLESFVPTSTLLSSSYGKPSIFNEGLGGIGAGSSNYSGYGSGSGSKNSYGNLNETITGVGNQNLTNPSIPPGFTAAQLSPYFEEIRLGGASPSPSSYGGYGGYGTISLDTNYSNPSSTIDVTGWKIKTNKGGEYIPQAVVLYDPAGIDAPSDIVMKSGDILNIYSDSAPTNLRLNECMGYLPDKSDFNPSLPYSCPAINTDDIKSFSGACQNYIMSLDGCSQPDFSSPDLPKNDYACRNYLTGKFNYKWCYDTYFSDPNFLSHEIRVWMGSSPLDPYHDNVELLDKNGLLVDYYSY